MDKNIIALLRNISLYAGLYYIYMKIQNTQINTHTHIYEYTFLFLHESTHFLYNIRTRDVNSNKSNIFLPSFFVKFYMI